MKISRLLIWALAGLFLLAGISGIVAPTAWTINAGLEPGTASGLTETRVLYGGVQLTIGGFFLWCGLAESRFSSGLMFSALLMGMTALSRGIGIVVDQSANTYHLGTLGFEASLLVLSVWLYHQVSRKSVVIG